MLWRFGTLIAAIVIVVFSGLSALAGQRVALVLGNSNYKHAPALANPSNDAAAVATLLSSAGFDAVETKYDLGINQMRRAIRDFSDKAKEADTAVLFYAGHGIEVDGINYLIPVDAALERDIDVEDEAVALERVLMVLQPAKRLRLVILDACRDNPFARSMKRTMASRSIGRGLARVEPTTTDTLIAFAAKAGSTAADGTNTHSPFTTALLKHMPTPGLDLRLAFGRVRDDVLRSTGSRQEPFVYGSLGGTTVALVPNATTAEQNLGTPVQAQVARDYELASSVATVAGWDAFLVQHPQGFYADLARANRAKLSSPKIDPRESSKLTSNHPARPETPANSGGESSGRVDIARLVSCCLSYCRRENCNSPPAEVACKSDFLRKQATSKAIYDQMILNFGCGTAAAQAAHEKTYCNNAVAAMRKMIASGQVEPQSPAANYVRNRCGRL